MRQSLEIGQRPWIGLDKITIRDRRPNQDPAQVELVFKNYGNTVATHVNRTVFMDLLAYKEFGHIGYDVTCGDFPQQVGTVLFPSNTDAIDVPLNDYGIGKLPPDNVKRAIYLVGCINYVDALGHSHWTHFCQIYDAERPGFGFCEANNTAD